MDVRMREYTMIAQEAILEHIFDIEEVSDPHDPLLNDLKGALALYKSRLNVEFDNIDPIALGKAGIALGRQVERFKEKVLPDSAASLEALGQQHHMFITKFPAWLEYVNTSETGNEEPACLPKP